MRAVALSHTSSCDRIFPIADGGDGLEPDLLAIREQIPGKCLMLNLGLSRKDSLRRNLHRAEKVSLALRYGASAVLFVHPGPDGTILTGTASLTGETLPIPALCISAEDGRTIRQWAGKENLMADFRVKNEEKSTWARNVVATIPAARPTRETILFTAHLDSWDLATGAIDNGTGSFTLLDVVNRHRHLLRRNVCFLWTMGEEQGLLGSRHFCEEWKKEGRLADIRMVINLDMIASPVGFNHFDWPGMAALTRELSSVIGLYVPSFLKKETGQPQLHSDHQPFMLEGVPVVTEVSSQKDSVLACYHADCDDFNLVNQEDMRKSAQVHSLLALFMGSREELPVRHLRPRQIPKWLENHGLKEKLQISREWRWK
jgi:Iap family predicted aminopeptidase